MPHFPAQNRNHPMPLKMHTNLKKHQNRKKETTQESGAVLAVGSVNT